MNRWHADEPQPFAGAVEPEELRARRRSRRGLVSQSSVLRGAEHGEKSCLLNLLCNPMGGASQFSAYRIKRLSHQILTTNVEKKPRPVDSLAATLEQEAIFLAIQG